MSNSIENISGINNFIKLINNKYEINIFITVSIWQYNNIYEICNNTFDNIDIDKYLINFFRYTSNKYNFYVYDFNKYDNDTQYTYYHQVLKIQNSYKLFKKNVKIIKFNVNKIESIHLTFFGQFIFDYYKSFEFDNISINSFNDNLKKLIINLNKYLNFDYNKLLQKIKDSINKIVITNIIKNYFINKIKILILECKKLIKYINKNINLLKVKYSKYTDEYYDTLKSIYITKAYICENLIYIISFFDMINILINILNNKIKKNIIYMSIDEACSLIYLLIHYFNFEIIYKSYSDSLIDNNLLEGINKIFKNIDISDITGIKFLINYLSNSIDCIQSNGNILN